MSQSRVGLMNNPLPVSEKRPCIQPWGRISSSSSWGGSQGMEEVLPTYLHVTASPEVGWRRLGSQGIPLRGRNDQATWSSPSSSNRRSSSV